MDRADGSWCRVYEIAKLDAARERMRASEAAEAELPEGFIDFAGVAAFFDVHPVVINKWQRLGRLGRGEWRHTPGKARRRVFAVAELEEAQARMRAEAERPTAPEGFIELHDAAELLDVHVGTIHKWELDGRLAEGQTVPIPGTSARTKIYPRAEIERLREAIRAEIENFPPCRLGDDGRGGAAGERVGAGVEEVAGGRAGRAVAVGQPSDEARCKLFAVEEVERRRRRAGRDHDFLLEPDGAAGGGCPAGYVGRAEAAAMLGARRRRSCGGSRWGGSTSGGGPARRPAQAGLSGRRAYDVNRLAAMVAAFEARGGPRADDADPAVARVPVFAPDGVARDALVDAADLPAVAVRGGTGRSTSTPRRQSRGSWRPCLPDGGQEALRLRLLGATPAERSRTKHLNGDRLDFRRANLLLKDGSEHIHGGRKCAAPTWGRCRRRGSRACAGGMAREVGGEHHEGRGRLSPRPVRRRDRRRPGLRRGRARALRGAGVPELPRRRGRVAGSRT